MDSTSVRTIIQPIRNTVTTLKARRWFNVSISTSTHPTNKI